MHETSLLSTPGQFGPVFLPLVSKNDDEELCFLTQFGFRYVNFLNFSLDYFSAN